MVDPEIFAKLQQKIDEDIEVRENLKGILQDLDRQGALISSSFHINAC